jgi:hypothetical protein
LVLVAILLTPPADPAAMQKVVVGQEKPVIESRPVEEEVAENQEEPEPGFAELRTVPCSCATRQSVADGHANPANGAAFQPTSPPALGFSASSVAQRSEPAPPMHTVVVAPGAHAGARASSGGDGLNG